MGAIPVHSTPVVDKPWDAAQAEKNLDTSKGGDYIKWMYAWQDPEADPDTKSAYKLPHHEVDSDGNIGAANVRACRAGIAALNGARGGVDIPRRDRPAVYEHLAQHLRDADIEPVPLRGTREAIERRAYEADLQVDLPKIIGHAAVFNARSEVLMEFSDGRLVEEIAPGAFRKTIQEADIRALINHDPNLVLGRNKAGTLRLYEDEHGLAVEITPPDTQAARDLLVLLERGDVSQMSFAFAPIKQTWSEERDEKSGITTYVRRLQEVRLYDVSVVTYPAYPQTDASVVRALLANSADAPFLESIAEKPHIDDRHTKEVSTRDEHFIRLELLRLELLGRL